ncbi:MAG: hypothetical protein L6R38_007503 [Xanthoria sp. 2 TBL-2021]|nr:MAG: hypothetical protein L6R38_007503 [Xanthoria sp. 2 TBL-2021]
MAPLKNVTVIGASGNVGKPVVDALLKAGFNVTALTRKSSSATFPSEVKVQSVDDSYPSDQLVAVLKGQDAVINLLPPMSVEQHNSIADAAAEAGVKRFIPSEFGSDTTSPKIVELVPIFGNKTAITNYLKTKESSGLSWTAVVNGAFFDWGLHSGILGFDLKTNTATIFDDGEAILNATNLSDVGQSIVTILSKPEETANKFVFIQNIKTTQNQILAALEKSTGKKWTVKNRSAAEARQTGGQKLGKGDMSGIPDLIVGGIYSGEPAADYATTRGLSNDLLGLKEYPLQQLIDQAIKA